MQHQKFILTQICNSIRSDATKSALYKKGEQKKRKIENLSDVMCLRDVL